VSFKSKKAKPGYLEQLASRWARILMTGLLVTGLWEYSIVKPSGAHRNETGYGQTTILINSKEMKQMRE